MSNTLVLAVKINKEQTHGCQASYRVNRGCKDSNPDRITPLPLGFVNLKACDKYFMKLQFVTANFGHHGLQFYTFVSQAIHETEKSE